MHADPQGDRPRRLAVRSAGDLRELRELELRENELAAVPEVLRGLPLLRRLDLPANRLGELPPWIAELPSLEKLGPRWNDVEIPAGVRRDLEARRCVVLR